jgi:hypothetical protein
MGPRIFLFSCVTPILLAQTSPLEGNWRMDPEQSRYTVGSPPVSETMNISQNGGRLRVQIGGIGNDGTPLETEFSVPEAGGTGQMQKSSQYGSVSAVRTDDRNWGLAFYKDDAELVAEHLAVAGETMHVSVRGVDADSNPVAGELVFRKQSGTAARSLLTRDTTSAKKSATPAGVIPDDLLKRYWHAQSDLLSLKMQYDQAQARMNQAIEDITKICGSAGMTAPANGDPQCGTAKTTGK